MSGCVKWYHIMTPVVLRMLYHTVVKVVLVGIILLCRVTYIIICYVVLVVS